MSGKESDLDSVDPREYGQSLEQLMACLSNLSTRTTRRWYSAAELSAALRDEWGIRVHWKTAAKVLGENRDLVDRRKRNGRWEFLLLAAGIERIYKESPRIVLVDPTDAVQAVVSLHDLLEESEDRLRICDPYFDAVSLEHLDSCKAGVEIQFLTSKIRDSGKVRRLMKALRDTGRRLEVRKEPTGTLHDRYLIDDSAMTILGTSLNGFGRKQSFVIRVGEDVKCAVEQDFERRWRNSKCWP